MKSPLIDYHHMADENLNTQNLYEEYKSFSFFNAIKKKLNNCGDLGRIEGLLSLVVEREISFIAKGRLNRCL